MKGRRTVGVAVAAYRLVLRAYPAPFRRTYAAEMTDAFERRLRSGRSRRLPFLVRAFGDALAGSIRLRLARRHRRRMPNRAPGGRFGVGEVLSDVRFTWRTSLRKPAVPLAIVATLALSIGAVTAMFSVVNAVLLTSLPYPNPDRLVRLVGLDRTRGIEIDAVNLDDVRDWVAQVDGLAHAAAYTSHGSILTGAAVPQRVSVASVSAGFFDVLGVTPSLGRVPSPMEFVYGSEPVVVLSSGFWQREFGGDPGVVGRRIRLDEVMHTVVGVLPPTPFQIPSNQTEAWTPLLISPSSWQYGRGPSWLSAIGRLSPAADLPAVQASLDLVADRLATTYPETNSWRGVRVKDLREWVVGTSRPLLIVLSLAVAFMLVIGCASVANLLLARAGERRREFAVRAAIGAARGRLMRQVLTEGLLLAVAGGLGGVVLARWTLASILAMGGDAIPRQAEIGIDGRVLAFSFAVSVFTGVLFALAPALRVMRVDFGQDMEVRGGGTGGLHRLRASLVLAQLVLTVVLVIGGALLAQSFARLSAVDLGFDRASIATFDVTLPEAGYPDPSSVRAFYGALLNEVSAAPNVTGVAAADRVPLAPGTWTDGFSLEGAERPPGQGPSADFRRVSSDYFSVLRIPIVSGRTFDDGDSETGHPVVVVNTVLADRYFDGENPVGRMITAYGERREIVGVVGSTRHRSVSAEGMPTLYFPWRQVPWQSATVIVRVSPGTSPSAEVLQDRVRAVDPDVPLTRLVTMEGRIAGSLTQPRFRATILGSLGALALVLSILGVYSVVSYAVAQRAREIGIRVALGSRPTAVRWLVARQGLILAGVAVGLGTCLAMLMSRALEGFVYGVTATDALTFVATPSGIVVVAVVASLIPAARASRVDPASVLREEL